MLRRRLTRQLGGSYALKSSCAGKLLRPPAHGRNENMEFLSLDLFFVRKVVAALVLPPSGPLIVALGGLFRLGRRPRLGRALAWLGLTSLLLLSMPAVSDALY